MRINKFLAAKGFGSRREIDRHVSEDKVFINGVVAKLGQILIDGDKVQYFKQEFNYSEPNTEADTLRENNIYIAFNKPAGVVCTCAEDEPDNIIDYLQSNPDYCLTKGLMEKVNSSKIYPIGRLDKDSRGLILLTNDGDLTQKLTHPKYEHEKEYLVTCRDSLDNIFLDKFSKGVEISLNDEGTEIVKTLPCSIKQIKDNKFTTVLKQGYKRQIREMVKVLNNRVTDIFRIRISNLALREYLQANNKGTTRHPAKRSFASDAAEKDVATARSACCPSSNNLNFNRKHNIIILDNLTEGSFIELEYSCLCH
jgi:23S rRNA pseudouridine2604 synthase